MLTEIVLHLRGDGATLDDGTPIPISVLERIAPESFLRALIHDAERRPINASARHRHPTTRQKRVVKERDRHCIDCGTHRTTALRPQPRLRRPPTAPSSTNSNSAAHHATNDDTVMDSHDIAQSLIRHRSAWRRPPDSLDGVGAGSEASPRSGGIARELAGIA